MSHNARYARLAIEYTKLVNLATRSDFIEIRPAEVHPGWPPEKYVVTYTCKGIASINEDGLPVMSEFHQLSMYMGSDYPFKEPYLKWLTPIWHPNIDHEEPHHVCTNNVQNWFAAKPLAELVIAIGEMVQYKHYHAKWVSPFPLDRVAAEWVLEVAEPRGILGPDKPIDDRPLLHAQRMRKKGGRSASKPNITDSRSPIKVGLSTSLMRSYGAVPYLRSPSGATAPLPARPARRTSNIRFGARRSDEEDATKFNAPVPSLAPASSPAGSASASYGIEVYKNGQLQRVQQIEVFAVSIGRGTVDQPIDLELAGDPTISRLHAVLERDEEGSFWLTAKGQNPIVISGRTLPRERSMWVEPGQKIEISSYSLLLQPKQT